MIMMMMIIMIIIIMMMMMMMMMIIIIIMMIIIIIIIIIAFKAQFEIFTISSLGREAFPIRTLRWPGRNRLQTECNK